MKRVIISLLATACLLGGCSEDNTDDTGNRGKVILSQETINAGPDGKTDEITITSSGDWRISGVSDWVRPSMLSGKSGDKIELIIDPNNTGKTLETVFKVFSGSAITPLKVISESGYYLNLRSEQNVMLSSKEGNMAILLNSNIDELSYDLSGDGETWLTFERESKDITGMPVIHYSVKESPDLIPRSTRLTITGQNKSTYVDITQVPVNKLEIEQTQYSFDISERTLTLTVETNFEFSVKTDDWITLNDRSYDGNNMKSTLKFNLSAATATRIGLITLFGGDLSPVKITVLQLNPDDTLISIPDPEFRKYLAANNWIVDIGGGNVIITEAGVNATTISYTPEWLEEPIRSVEGIEHFKNLTSIDLMGNCLRELDISALTKVSTVKIDYMPIEVVKLGDNPVNMIIGQYLFFYDYNTYTGTFSKSLTISSSKMTTLTLTYNSSSFYDQLEWVDVSECPSLLMCFANRSPGVLKTVYLKTGQSIPTLMYTAGAEVVYK